MNLYHPRPQQTLPDIDPTFRDTDGIVGLELPACGSSEETRTPEARLVRALERQRKLDTIKPSDLELDTCPPAGAGVHHWLFATACQLVRMGLSNEQISGLLAQWVEHVQRPIYEREVVDAIHGARRSATGLDAGGVAWKHRIQKPTRQEKLHALARAKRVSGISTLDGLLHSSPVQPPQSTDAFIDALFPPDSLICSGSEVWECKVRPREELRGQWDQVRHIVPSPMSSPTGLNLNGDMSDRCLDNTGPRRFLVLESDELNYDEASAMLAWIGRRLPLVAVVYSGNKSLHGWYFVEGRDEDETDRLRSECQLLWLDPATFTACHPVRTPGVERRETGRIQQCLWFAGLDGKAGVH